MNVIGICIQCGGQVCVPTVWQGTIPPIPTCVLCGAHAANRGPIIETKRVHKWQTPRMRQDGKEKA